MALMVHFQAMLEAKDEVACRAFGGDDVTFVATWLGADGVCAGAFGTSGVYVTGDGLVGG